MSYAANVDANQGDIVRALRKVGASVLHLHQLGQGAPDLLVGFRGRDQLLELKVAKGKVEQHQLSWHQTWRGRAPVVVRSPEEALRAIGALR